MPEKQSSILRSNDLPTDIEQREFADLLSKISAELESGNSIDWTQLEKENARYANDLKDIRPAMEALQNLKFKNDSTCPVTKERPEFSPKEESQTLGDFRIVREIGRGGMGVVYEAQQISIDRLVALKILPLAELIDERALARFKNEVSAIATLDHPHIVSVYSIGEQRGVHYYAMQLIHGQSLAVVIRELRARSSNNEPVTGKMIDQLVSQFQSDAKDSVDAISQHAKTSRISNWEELNETAEETRARAGTGTSRVTDRNYFRNIARLIIDAAEALDHAHEYGIVHRDIKPGNLLLNKKGKLYITDFGLARIEAGAGVTMTGDVIGTLRYMSPEQVLAGRANVDHRTDIYSLGATLYELLTLHSIWSGHDRADLISKISFEEPIRPQKINPAIPSDLETIVLKSLTKNPNERYASAHQLAEDLQRFLDDKPVVAKRPTVVQRINKWSRRNPALVWSAALLLIVATIASVVSAVLISNQKELAVAAAQKEEEARKRAEQRSAQLVQGNKIITSIFQDLDINEVKEGPDPLEAILAKRLVNAGKQITGESIGDPLVVAEMQERLGKSLMSLGFYEEALELLQQSWAIRSELLELDDPVRLSSINGLALAYTLVGQLDKAISLGEQAMDKSKNTFAADDSQTPELMSATMDNLGMAYLLAGQLDKAILMLEQSSALCMSTLGPDHPDTLSSMSNLALAYLESNQVDKALPMLEKDLEFTRLEMGEDHPSTIGSMNNLAGAYKDLGQLEKAIKMLEQTLKLSKSKFGSTHPRTLTVMNNLGSAYKADRQLDKALPLFELTLELAKSEHGPNHPDTLFSMSSLAAAYRTAGQLDKAVPLCRETFELRKLILSPDHPDTLRSMSSLAGAYRVSGQLDLAVPLFEQLLEKRKANLSPDHPSIIATMKSLAWALVADGQVNKAVPVLEQTVKLLSDKHGARHASTLIVVVELGIAYKRVGRMDESLELLEQARDAPNNERFIVNHGVGLVDAYVKTGKQDLAEELANEVLECTRRELSENSSKRAKQLAVLSRVYFFPREAYSDAEPMLRESLAIYEKANPDKWQRFETMSLLGESLLGQEKYSQAEPLLLAGNEGLVERAKLIQPIDRTCLTESLERLIKLYESWNAAAPDNGYESKAAQWRETLKKHCADLSLQNHK